MRPYSPGGTLIAFASPRKGSTPPTASVHRLRRGLPGYLILFAPHAFASQRQSPSRSPPSPLVFLPISTNFTSTPGIPRPSPGLEHASFTRTSEVEPRDFARDLTRRLKRFTPNNSEQRSHPLYYRGCWHRVSRCFLSGYRQSFVPRDSALRPEGLHRTRGVAASGFCPLRKIPHCCLP